MADNPFLEVIRVWAGLAWADGRLAVQEAQAMRKLIGMADMPDADRDAALSYLDGPVPFDAGSLATLDRSAREGIYRAAVRLAMVDREFAPDERTFLDRLRDGLALDVETAASIEAAERLPS
ncbi:MAG: TerB family tellurite resistance protein [Deltaproteobacteria bacterium]|nr:MAG: TerB family tellurite resistance protein [Deltaproteobacteria bacterium]